MSRRCSGFLLLEGVEVVSWHILKDSHFKNVLPQGKISPGARGFGMELCLVDLAFLSQSNLHLFTP